MSLLLTAIMLVVYYGVITPADGTTKLLNAVAYASGQADTYQDWPEPWELALDLLQQITEL